jgi:hypothetical protein
MAGNSRWMQQMIAARLAQLSRPTGREAPHAGLVRFGLPLDIFKPREKSVCREILNLPQDKFIILFSCSNLAEPRKGIDHLVRALQLLDLPDLAVVCAGHSDLAERLNLESLVRFGYVKNPLQLALLYSAADLFVGPALEEAFGQVFIEAAACGTPAVGYPVGGVPDALRQGITGQLAATVTPEALAQTIGALYADPALRQRLAVCGRLFVENEFSPAASYHKLAEVLHATLAAHQIRLVPKITPQLQPIELPPMLYIQDLLRKNSSVVAKLFKRKSKPTSVTLETRAVGLWPGALTGAVAGFPKREPCEARAEEYFQQQLNQYRQSKVPWILKPGAWLVRYKRNAMRRAVPKSAL